MKRVKLKVAGISFSRQQAGTYTLLLSEENGDRTISITIGGFEAQAIVIKLEHIEPPRPLTHDLFKVFAQQFNMTISEVMINKIENGRFYSVLVCNSQDKKFIVDSRTSDAIALALRFGCPIYINEETLDNIQKTFNPSQETTEQKQEPAADREDDSEFEHYSLDELSRMIKIAVDTEDYERAALLRDEIEKRNKDNS